MPNDRGGLPYQRIVTQKQDRKGRVIERVTNESVTRQAKKAAGLSGRQWKKYRKDRRRKARAGQRIVKEQ